MNKEDFKKSIAHKYDYDSWDDLRQSLILKPSELSRMEDEVMDEYAQWCTVNTPTEEGLLDEKGWEALKNRIALHLNQSGGLQHPSLNPFDVAGGITDIISHNYWVKKQPKDEEHA